jgi:hypothetical protein
MASRRRASGHTAGSKKTAKKPKNRVASRRGTRDPFIVNERDSAKIPHAFVLDELDSLDPITKPMFGCRAVYVGPKIVFILRARGKPRADDGIWVATETEHHESLRREFPSLRAISIFGPGETKWQNLPADAEDFEEGAVRLCALVLKRDPRIGKVPARKKKSTLRARS